MTRTPLIVLMLCAVVAADAARAQDSPAPSAPSAAPPPAAASASTSAAAPSARAAAPVRGAQGPAAAPNRAASRGPNARAMDSLELDTTQITGNRELPKVMVVVPWKKSDIGDLVGKPVNSLVDEALEPVDREVFRREVDYYGALAPDRPQAARSETGVTAPEGAPRAEK
jgi:hypothetical protein